MRGIPRRLGKPSPATLISLIALFVSLGGVSYAAAKIGSSQIKDNSIQSKDIRNKAIALNDLSTKTRNGLHGARGGTGPTGATGPAGPAGRSALSTLQSGERIYGTFALQGQGPNLWTGVSFQVPAPAPVDSRHVVIAGNDTVTGDGCTGSKTNPVSAPGYVCIYPSLSSGTSTGYGWGVLCSCGDATAQGDGSPAGFIVQVNGASATLMTSNGVWVYTAP
jgi:hypothetical protein